MRDRSGSIDIGRLGFALVVGMIEMVAGGLDRLAECHPPMFAGHWRQGPAHGTVS